MPPDRKREKLLEMCGIAGFADRRTTPSDAAAILERMTASLRHRGPDGEGREVLTRPEGLVALGHTRLAIIDLSPGGHQPMPNAARTVWVTFNGEIYNFQELRAELEAEGAVFRSHSDTEVIVQLYERRGTDALRRLDGMFALGIYDARHGTLVLARDPLGIKPLYWAEPSAGRVVFGSEIKALLASDFCRVDVDWQAAHDFFTFLYVPCPATMFRGIAQLEPGHALSWDLARGARRIEKFWAPRRLPEVERASPAERRERVKSVLGAAVRRQLVSDVPLGIFLSGGIDSPIVAGLARDSGAPVSTYTVAFRGARLAHYDEAELAAAVSRHLGTEHHELSVDVGDPEAMVDLLGYFDQPFGNPTYYLMYLISREARRHITVALSGAGGDELYAGYPRYRALRLAERMRWVPRRLLRAAGRGLAVVKDDYRSMTLRRLREFVAGLDDDPVRQFVNWTYFFDEGDKARLFGPRGGGAGLEPSERVVRRALAESPMRDPQNRWLHADVRTFLLDNLLEYSDKMSMAASLEARVPLLDAAFVELSLNVPFAEKLAGRRSKLLLREAFAGYFPPDALRAPKKGFNAPLPMWMQDTFDSYFDDAPGRWGAGHGVTWRSGILERAFIDRLRGDFRAGRADTSHELFAVLAFDVWWRRYVEPVSA